MARKRSTPASVAGVIASLPPDFSIESIRAQTTAEETARTERQTQLRAHLSNLQTQVREVEQMLEASGGNVSRGRRRRSGGKRDSLGMHGRIAEALVSGGDMTPSDIATAVVSNGWPQSETVGSAVNVALGKMTADKLITKVDRGVYRKNARTPKFLAEIREAIKEKADAAAASAG